MKKSVTELPFNAFLGIECGKAEGKLLRLPQGDRYLNHLGTVHASALLALAEAASGELLLRHFGDWSGVVPVVRRLEAKFRKPAVGSVTADAPYQADALEKATADLVTKGRALVSVDVVLHDANGAHVLSAQVEWFLQQIEKNP